MWKSLAATATVFLFSATLATSPVRAEGAPLVATSIQPLHSLAAAVMKGVGEPRLIVSGHASEHGYALKPSDARLIRDAALVMLVDEHYETFMAKPLEGRGDTGILALAEIPGMTVRAPREGGVWEPHHHGHEDHDEHGHDEHGHDEHDHDGHDHEALDGHLWLDPMNARMAVTALAERLSEIDPAHAGQYAANARETTARLDALDQDLKQRLAPLAGKPFVVFHDAYHYLEERYGLTAAGSITVDPDRPTSAKRLAQLRDRLTSSGVACVFREPQFPAPIVATLAEAAHARQGVLDPQGADIPLGPDHYFTLMEHLADGLTSCLSSR